MSTVNEFDLIVKPSFKTKRAIWKHFGFPAMILARLQTRRRPFVDFAAVSGNTSNLKSHLQRCHAQEHRALQQQDSDDRPGPSSASAVKTSAQLTNSGTLTVSALFSNESVKHKHYSSTLLHISFTKACSL